MARRESCHMDEDTRVLSNLRRSSRRSRMGTSRIFRRSMISIPAHLATPPGFLVTASKVRMPVTRRKSIRI